MVLPKRITKNGLAEFFIFFYLAIFPLGQLIRFKINLMGSSYPLHPVDIVALIVFSLFILGRVKQPKVVRYFLSFLATATFSTLIASFFISRPELIRGVLYLLRLMSYVSIIPIIWSLFANKNKKELLFKSLIAVCFAVVIFGWIQYLWLPDLRDLKYIGWDDHYYRLFGTFLDPAFTGLIIVFGSLITLSFYLKTKNYKYLYLIILFLFTLLLTYSRDSYLAFFIGLIVLLFHSRKKLVKYFLVISFLFVISIPFLPRNISEAAKLERTYSIFAKFDDWRDTMTIISYEPLFGVGFNNICVARLKYLGEGDEASHACSGSDSSLLLVLATTGVVGFSIFINLLIKVAKNVENNNYGNAFKACSAALFIHSLFVNSLFYPWVMGFMGILLAISLKERSGG